MYFKICLKVDLLSTVADDRLSSVQEEIDSMIHPLCDALGIRHERTLYNYCKDEIDEMRGIKAYGFAYDLCRKVQSLENYCSFVKIFEGLSELLSRTGDPVWDCEMVLEELRQ